MRISHHCCYVTVLQMTLSESDAFLPKKSAEETIEDQQVTSF